MFCLKLKDTNLLSGVTEPGFDNFLKEFKVRIKKLWLLYFRRFDHHGKEPNYFADDLFAIKSDYLDDEYIFTASHEFEVEIQKRGLRYIKEYKRNEWKLHIMTTV